MSLTDQILRTRWVLLVADQIVEEQLDIGPEAGDVIAARSHEAVHLHRAVVPEVKVEVVACNRDCGDWRSGL